MSKETMENIAKQIANTQMKSFAFKGQISSAVFDRIRNLKSGTVKYADLEGWNSQYDKFTCETLSFDIETGAMVAVVPVRLAEAEYKKVFNGVCYEDVLSVPAHYEATGEAEMYVFSGSEWVLLPGYNPQEQKVEEIMKHYK